MTPLCYDRRVSGPEQSSPSDGKTPDQEIAPGLWLRHGGTTREYLEVLVRAEAAPELLQKRRLRMAGSMAFVHQLVTQGPSDVTLEGIEHVLPFGWDDTEGIINAAQAADAWLGKQELERTLKGLGADDSPLGRHLIDLAERGRIHLTWPL